MIAARRRQAYALRSAFVLGLLCAILLMGINTGAANIVAVRKAPGALADLGESLFMAVIGTQLTLVLLAAPAATAGTICLDCSRGTLAHLLVTDLSNAEIVLGKLAARLTPIVVLIVATLPVMELLTLLGGVDPAAILGASLVTLGVAVLGCCLALVFSIWLRRTHEALLATYAVWGVWLLGRPMLGEINRSTGFWIEVFRWDADPYGLAFAAYWRHGDWALPLDVAFLAATLGISAVLVLLAVLTLRAPARATPDGGRRKPRSHRSQPPSRPGAWRPGCSPGWDRRWTSTRSSGASGSAPGRRLGRGSSRRCSGWSRCSSA